jgi:hypothetical protein
MRIEVVLSVVVLVGVVVFVSLLALVSTYGMPNVLACLKTHAPATIVKVESGRIGVRIVERDIFGCTLYWHVGRGG